MSADANDKEMSKDESLDSSQLKNPTICVIIGHSVEAITSAVVLASLGQRIHLYANKEELAQQLQQYGFEHHLQALWQMYQQQQMIISQALPSSADMLIQGYEKTNCANSDEVDNNHDHTEPPVVALYWLFLNSMRTSWTEDHWITAFNHSNRQALPLIMSGIEQLGDVSALMNLPHYLINLLHH